MNALVVPSKSVDVNVPLAVNTALVSVKLTVLLPVIIAASLVPLITNLTFFVLPSTDATVKVSTIVRPAPKYCVVLLVTV